MYLRRAAAQLRRRLTHPSQLLNHSRAGESFNSGKIIFSYHGGPESHNWSRRHQDAFIWIFLSGQAVMFLGLNDDPVLAEDVSNKPVSESDTAGEPFTGLRRIEDGSVVSNLHTSKWRVFTDSGRDLFLQGKLEDAERMFIGALQEAIEGFGEKDPHVASACNNLSMREAGGYEIIKKAIAKLELKHKEHIAAYGEGNERRLTGHHETADINTFKWGVADRGASIRVGRDTEKEGKGYFEDRRPASNMDPYVVTSMIAATTIL